MFKSDKRKFLQKPAQKGSDLPDVVKKYLGGMMHPKKYEEGGEVKQAGQGQDLVNLSLMDKIRMAKSGIDPYTGKPKKYFGGGIVAKKTYQPMQSMEGQDYSNQYGEDEDDAEDQLHPDMGYDLGERSQESNPAQLAYGGYAEGGEYEGEDEDEAGEQADESEYASHEADEHDLEQSGPTDMDEDRLSLAKALLKKKKRF